MLGQFAAIAALPNGDVVVTGGYGRAGALPPTRGESTSAKGRDHVTLRPTSVRVPHTVTSQESMTSEAELADLRRELAVLRLNQSSTRSALVLLFGIVACGVVFEMVTRTTLVYGADERTATLADSVLRVRGLIVTDAHGVERVVIGAPLPDPMFLGKRHQRQGKLSGILMFDAMGTERNGYGTSDESDEMIFTMDNIAGQSALFIANPGTGTHLTAWDTRGNSVRMGVYQRPMLYVEREGRRTFTAPDSGGGVR